MKQSTRLELLLWAVVIIFFTVLATVAHCETQWPKQRSQKQVVATANPTAYLFGIIEDGRIFRYHGNLVTSLRIQPQDTKSIYDTNITFCGDISKMFKGKSSFVVFSFDRVIHQGSCYDLISIHEVVE